VPSHRADTPPVRRDEQPLRRPRDNRKPVAPSKPRRPRTSLSAPQVGIAGALGIATIAAPISGAMANPMPKAQVNHIKMVAAPAQIASIPSLPTAGGIGVKALRVIPAADLSNSAPAMLAAPRTLLVTRASRAGERSVLPGCTGINTVPANAVNGELPASSLCTLWDPKHRLRADFAVALAKLNVAYKQHFGESICLTDSYRTIAEQRRLRAIKPGLAAIPGTSEHGLGLAVDLCGGVERGSGARYQWMRANAPAYGIDNPAWALAGASSQYEPWHWEYVAGE
jgi:D-alanyl-D-alanine carboxypeptidase